MKSLVLAAIALAVGPPLAHAQVEPTQAEPSRVAGIAIQVGVEPPPGEDGSARVRLSGKLSLTDTIDLADAVVILEEVISLEGEELVKGADGAEVLPATLLPRPRPFEARRIYESDPTEVPRFQLRIRRHRRNTLRFILKADQATIPVHPCLDSPTTTLATSFRIEPPEPAAALLVSALVEWRCETDRLDTGFKGPDRPGGGHPPEPPPDGGCGLHCEPAPGDPPPNKTPTASLRSNLLTRTTGEPDIVEFDATGSQDRDGAVVRYVFDSGDGRSQDGPSPFMRLTYAPGDYRAHLMVYDDEGAPSAIVSRGFSIK